MQQITPESPHLQACTSGACDCPECLYNLVSGRVAENLYAFSDADWLAVLLRENIISPPGHRVHQTGEDATRSNATFLLICDHIFTEDMTPQLTTLLHTIISKALFQPPAHDTKHVEAFNRALGKIPRTQVDVDWNTLYPFLKEHAPENPQPVDGVVGSGSSPHSSDDVVGAAISRKLKLLHRKLNELSERVNVLADRVDVLMMEDGETPALEVRRAIQDTEGTLC